jgi:hypothetical protein
LRIPCFLLTTRLAHMFSIASQGPPIRAPARLSIEPGPWNTRRIVERRCCLSETQDSNPVNLWLLDADPAIRWQVMRDLLGKSKKAVELERRKLAHEGWGARLLNAQDPKGTWAGGQSLTPVFIRPNGHRPHTPCLCSGISVCRPPTRRRKRPARTFLRRLPARWWHRLWIEREPHPHHGMVASILSYFEFDDDLLTPSRIGC